MKSMLTSPSRCNMRCVNMLDISQPNPNAMRVITARLVTAKRRRKFSGGVVVCGRIRCIAWGSEF